MMNNAGRSALLSSVVVGLRCRSSSRQSERIGGWTRQRSCCGALRVWTTEILGTARVELYMGKHESVDPSQHLCSKRTRSSSLLCRCTAVDYFNGGFHYPQMSPPVLDVHCAGDSGRASWPLSIVRLVQCLLFMLWFFSFSIGIKFHLKFHIFNLLCHSNFKYARTAITFLVLYEVELWKRKRLCLT
jgi:hypothetical protein